MSAAPDRADDPGTAARRREKRLTYRNLGILLALGTLTTMLVMEGRILLELRFPDPGTFLAEATGYVLLFDAYFYVLHRLLHAPLAFRAVHGVHHRSRVPNVWATIAMHPLEFTLLAGFLPVTMWLVPAHLASVGAVGFFLSCSITLAHSATEVVPRRWRRERALGIYLTPRIHAAHHALLHCNYGATVTLFDRLFGTLRPEGDERSSTSPRQTSARA